jgi:hypothetical protein
MTDVPESEEQTGSIQNRSRDAANQSNDLVRKCEALRTPCRPTTQIEQCNIQAIGLG